jgi:hypothetical protein
MTLCTAGLLLGQPVDQAPPNPSQEQPEVLTRGTVHEGFAEPVNLEPQQDMVVQQAPPPQVQEMPPDQRPEGGQFVWVPGYWSWDVGRNGYIWTSGCWRAAPPNRYWVPGYWNQVSGGYAWVPGFWAPTGTQQIQYLAEPPVIQSVEPPGAPPSPDEMWIPPCPYWYQGSYVMRPGYWLAPQLGWLWMPSHYIRTPRGYVFVSGYWDYALDRRGVLFAPVCFGQPFYTRPGYFFSPSITLDLGPLQFSLFTYPSYSHYCFGDYYDDSFISIGIFPWFEVERHHRWYDPVFEYDRWSRGRTDPRWLDRERHEYDLRRSDRTLRPPVAYRDLEARRASIPQDQRRDFLAARPLNEVVRSGEDPVRFQRIDSATQRKIASQATKVQRFRDDRTRWEAAPSGQRAAQQSAEQRRAEQRQQQTQAQQDTERQANLERQQQTQTQQNPERQANLERQQQQTEQQRAAQQREQPRGQSSMESRSGQASRPDTVRIPRSPISGRAAPQARPPSSPSQERQSQTTQGGRDGGRGGGSTSPRGR